MFRPAIFITLFITITLFQCSNMAEYLEYDWRVQSLSTDKIRGAITFKTEPIDKAKSIQDLKTLIYASNDLEFKNNIQQDDEFILKFLHARKFNVNDSYQLLLNYYWYRRKNPTIFTNFYPSADDIQKALQDGFPGVLKSRDRRGRCVLVMNATNWDCSYTLVSIYRALLISLEHLTKDRENQANGFVVIVDWTEFSFKQSTKLAPKVLKLMIEGLQDCFPARFKGIHFIGQPWYVDAALMVIKQFLKDKIKERIYVHGNNLSTLFDYVPRDILPTELGGEQSSYNPNTWIERLMNETNC